MGFFHDFFSKLRADRRHGPSREECLNLAAEHDAIQRAMPVVEFSPDGTILSANEKFLRIGGFELADLAGKHHRDFIEPEDARRPEYDVFWRELARGKPRSIEARGRRADGSEVWVEAFYSPVTDAEGRVYKVVCLGNDITRRMTQAADSASQIEAIGKSYAVIEFDIDGTILRANSNYLDLTGYTSNELRGRHQRVLLDPVDAEGEQYQAYWRRLVQGEWVSGVFRRVAKDGREFWIDGSYNPIRDHHGRVYKVVEFATDVTERHAAATENRVLRTTLDHAPSKIMLADADMNISYINDALETFFDEVEGDMREMLPNFESHNLVGKNVDQFHRHPERVRKTLEHLDAPMITTAELAGLSLKFVFTPLFGENGERLGTIVEWINRTEEVAFTNELSDVVQGAIAGDLSRRIAVEGSATLYARLSKAINQLVSICDDIVGRTVQMLGSLAGGDLSRTMDGEYSGEFGKLKDDFNTTIAKLTGVVASIQSTATAVKVAADEISRGNTDLSQRAEEQASSLEETAATIEELTSTVAQNANNARAASELAKETRHAAEQGSDVVRRTIDAMSEIDQASARIVDIIGVIDEIAFQTNLLALNASVEAARAGDQGRGFAVVASEVRDLAGRSATAAKEIKGLIADSSRRVTEGSRLVDESGETLSDIVERVKQVTDIVTDIASASVEQAAGIEEVNKAVCQLDQLTQQSAVLVEEDAAASEAMGDQADKLAHMIRFFKVSNDRRTVDLGAPSVHGRRAGYGRRATDRPLPEAGGSSDFEQRRGFERRASDRRGGDSNSPRTGANAPRHLAAVNANDEEWAEF